MGKGTGEVNDPEVERLVDDIEETREEMTGTVEEIGDRLDPKNIVEDAKQTVKAATVGKVEDMATTAEGLATEATETVRDVGSDVIDTITRNPVPAAMVGLGIGWLIMSGRSSKAGSQHRTNGGDPLRQAKRQVSGIATDAQQTMEHAATEVGRIADEVPYQVRATADDLGMTASEMYQSNPLAVGAIAVAVGTAIGLALPVTSFERRTVGQPAREALSRAGDVAKDAMSQVEDQAREMEDQAREEDRQTRTH
jgi:hypothetical protein